MATKPGLRSKGMARPLTRALIAPILVALALSPDAALAQAVPEGPTFLVPGGSGVEPTVAMTPDGRFVVAYGSGVTGPAIEIMGQRYDAAADTVGGLFQVNTYTTGPQSAADVAMEPDGSFVVVWEGYGPGDASGVFARRYDSTGLPLGSEFLVNTHTTSSQRDPAVTKTPDRGFVAVWSTFDQDGDDFGVAGQRFDSTGTPSGVEFQVNSYTTGGQRRPDVSADQDGNVIVVWEGAGSEDDQGIMGQRYDSDGNPVGNEFLVNASAADVQVLPSVAVGGSGSFVVAWSGRVTANKAATFARRFDSTGVPIGDDFQSTKFSELNPPSVAADGGGGFDVVWKAGTFFDGGRGQRFNSNGEPEGQEFFITDTGLSFTAASAADGDFVVVWGHAALIGRRFAVASPDVLTAGRKLAITNKVPDDPQRNKATWVARGDNIVMGGLGTPRDPRCNGDPAGTVKASIRLFSGTSGQDTGEIPLPCQNWSLVPPNSPKGYRYKDRELDDGPCARVDVREGKKLKAVCPNRGPLVVPYDLVPGVDEGIINVTLTSGTMRYCTAFEDFNGKDGSDGKRFQGKNPPPPASCAEPPSASGAFLDGFGDLIE